MTRTFTFRGHSCFSEEALPGAAATTNCTGISDWIFAQASRNATDTMAKRVTSQLATAYSQGGAQLSGYSQQAGALASKRFKASLATPSAVFVLTRSPDGNGNVLLQIDKDTGQPRSRVDLGKQREPVYAVDDISGMLFLQTTSGTLTGYKL